MFYLSTRGYNGHQKFCDILLEGLAPDGGLYLPATYPQVNLQLLQRLRDTFTTKGYAYLAFEILSLYIDDIPAEDLLVICRKTYTAEVFGDPLITPLRNIDGDLHILALSNGARSGLTGFVAGVSRAIVQHNVTINNMLPERFDTPRQQQMAKLAMAMKNITYEEARAEIADSIAAKRFGRPEEFGDACAFLCSAQAGFISGQNLQLDGGSYHGLI